MNHLSSARTPARLLAPSIALLGAALVLGLLVRGPATPTEQRIAAAIVEQCPGWLAAFGDVAGSLPVFAALCLLGAALAWLARRRADAVTLLVGLTIEIPTELLKIAIDRARPPTANEIEAFGSIASYPSGHVARIVVLASLVVALFLWQRIPLRPIAIALATVLVGLVGVARVGLGAHWPTDVIGAILLGIGWSGFAIQVARRLIPSRRWTSWGSGSRRS
jgi:undecaprenyl-diphosphatase